ncbi:MAG: 16S rRNA methyltransferase [Thermoplasmata archaeon]|nr:MAG: 16S rRNA methyltransferase [Thermoplasmata archaeon]
MIHLLFADSSLELVPENLLGHPAVKKYAKRYNKGKDILLDDSYFHSAMRNMEDRERRGRPDIVHFCLLSALGSPLCQEGKLKVYVHTLHNQLLKFKSVTRLPRNYDRFKGLMEEVLRDGMSKNELIVMEDDIDLKEFFTKINCKTIIGFSVEGEKKRLSEIIFPELLKEDVALIIGAFPRGHFSEDIINILAKKLSIYSNSLDAWIVTSRVLGRIEAVYGLF